MTQADLAGDMITRNMLSLIENETALPSLQTVIYLASRLSVPVGYLLAQDDDELLYRKLNAMGDIKRTYRMGDFGICREICRTLCSNQEAGDDVLVNDDEVNLILAGCNLGIAREEFSEGRLRAACEYFEAAYVCCNATAYDTNAQAAQAAVYCGFIGSISPSLYYDIGAEGINAAAAMGDALCVYIIALDYLKSKSDADANENRAVCGFLVKLLDDFGQNAAPLACHIGAKLKMYDSETADTNENDRQSLLKEAQTLMNNALHAEGQLPEPVLYCIFGDLETCCRETGDYRGAYEYSNSKIALLEKFITERK